MKKKVISAVALSLVTAAGAFGFAGCGPKKTTENYNIIFANSTIPPVMASLKSIQNGYDTYAYIQRGKTYAGIDLIDQFHNIGYTQNNNNNPVTQAEVATVADAVEQLAQKNSKAKFTIYVTDYNAYAGYAIAYRAGLTDDRFEIKLCEDGTGAYWNFTSAFVTGKSATTTDEPYAALLEAIDDVEANVEALKTTDGAALGDTVPMMDYVAPYAMPSLENCSYYIQDKDILKSYMDDNVNIAGSKIYQSLGMETAEAGTKVLNIDYGTNSSMIAGLTAEQKTTYLTLMLGQYRAEADAMFKRTTLADGTTQVPEKKFVYVGGRAQSQTIGMEGLAVSEFPATYSAVNDFTKTFLSEADYNLIVETLANQAKNYTADQKKLAYNTYIQYRYSMWFTTELYGEEYDLLYKGHPSEVVTDYAAWQDTRYTSSGVNYKDALYDLVNMFYQEDSVGKRWGLLPGGVSIENFAYLDAEFAIGGQNSSTYTGIETYVPVEFVMSSAVDALAEANGNLSARIDDGTLLDGDGSPTLYLNKAALYQAIYNKYSTATEGNGLAIKTAYKNLLDAAKRTLGVTAGAEDNYKIAANGAIVNANGSAITRNVTYIFTQGTVNGSNDPITKTIANGQKPAEFTIPNPVCEGYVFDGWELSDTDTAWAPAYMNSASTENIQVTAKWKKIVEVKVEYADGADYATPEKTFTAVQGEKLLAKLNALTDVTNPSPAPDTEYTIEWYIENGTSDTKVDENTVVGLSELHVYAKWVVVPAQA